MSIVRYKASFRPARSATEAPLLATGASPASSLAMSPTRSPEAPVSRTARMLALAYCVHHMVERGELRDYAEAACRLGVTRARVAQIVAMLNLAVPLQEAILTGRLNVSERELRRACTESNWNDQVGLLGIDA